MTVGNVAMYVTEVAPRWQSGFFYGNLTDLKIIDAEALEGLRIEAGAKTGNRDFFPAPARKKRFAFKVGRFHIEIHSCPGGSLCPSPKS